MRRRLYLTQEEVQKIFKATAGSINQERDKCMILLCFIHGFRVSELTGIKLTDIDFLSKTIYIRRLKSGFSTKQPLHPRELELLNQWMLIRPKYQKKKNSEWLFLSRSGERLSRQRFYSLLRNYGENAQLPIAAHPHMLRHACGYELAEQGLDTRLIQDYLGHRNIRHTVHYTASNAARFSSAWKDVLENEPHEINESTLW